MARESRRLERRPTRLDQPQDVRRGIALPTYNPEAMGRISERVARFLGTWRFIGYMTLFIAAWIIYNVIVPKGHGQFDAWSNKFTLLTLLLSLQASYAAPLILLAQNRQADRDRVQYESDRALSERAVDDTEYLARELASVRVSLGEVATRDFLRSELQRLLEELDDRAGHEPGQKSEKSKSDKGKSDKAKAERKHDIETPPTAVADPAT
jgi:uncharacterized membrane protein